MRVLSCGESYLNSNKNLKKTFKFFFYKNKLKYEKLHSLSGEVLALNALYKN